MVTDSQVEILQRLRTTQGHLRAVIEMAESGQPCEQILHQLNAVQSALSATALRLVLCQAESSRVVILDSLSPNERIKELKRLQSLYTIFLRCSNRNREVIHE